MVDCFSKSIQREGVASLMKGRLPSARFYFFSFLLCHFATLPTAFASPLFQNGVRPRFLKALKVVPLLKPSLFRDCFMVIVVTPLNTRGQQQTRGQIVLAEGDEQILAAIFPLA
jgi:hypothetical protein